MHLNWLSWFRFLILAEGPLVILIICIIFAIIPTCFQGVYIDSLYLGYFFLFLIVLFLLTLCLAVAVHPCMQWISITKTVYKNLSDKIWLVKNMTNLSTKNSKNVYNRRWMALLKASSSSSFSNCPCSSSFKFSMRSSQFWKRQTLFFQKMHNIPMFFLTKPGNLKIWFKWFKKCTHTERRAYKVHKIWNKN